MNIMLKLSGESLGGTDTPFALSTIDQYAKVIADCAAAGNRVFVVTGGGNICRGKQCKTDRAEVKEIADYIGMLGTVQNCLQLKKALMELDVPSKVVIPDNFHVPAVCEYADSVTEDDRIVLLGGGIGRPGFSTDMATVTNAIKYSCDKIMFSKNGVDGVLEADPSKVHNPKLLERLTYGEYLERGLGVIDLDAMEKLADHPEVVSHVFLMNPDNLRKMLLRDGEGMERFSTITG